MILVIEGADKTGKTKLARYMADRLNWKYVHFGPPGQDPAREYANYLLSLREPVVCDRFFVGELVYGPMLRNSIMDPLKQQVIERLARLRGMVLVHAVTPWDVVHGRFINSKDKEHVNLAQNEKAYKAFKQVMKLRNVMTYTYSGVTVKDMTEMADFLIDPVKKAKHLAMKARASCTGIGTIQGPKMVLVGESVNMKTSWMGLPFDNGPAAEFLDQAIHDAKIDESKLYLTNADMLCKSEVDLLNSTGTTQWTALGNEADAKLKELGVEHAVMYHPQYWRRFHWGEAGVYATGLKKLFDAFRRAL